MENSVKTGGTAGGVKAFDRWDMTGIEVTDLGLRPYVTLRPRLVPKSGARYAGNKFHKSRIFIVERLINKLMNSGHKSKKHNKSSGSFTGKSQTTSKIVEEAFELIEKKTKENPVKVLARAIENAAPREEIISIEYGGARYPKAVEASPQRRIDVALRYMTQGAYARSFNSRKKIVAALADEIISAYNLSMSSAAIAKKQELERQADSSR
jgi:small subunit ribosomal protein S7